MPLDQSLLLSPSTDSSPPQPGKNCASRFTNAFLLAIAGVICYKIHSDSTHEKIHDLSIHLVVLAVTCIPLVLLNQKTVKQFAPKCRLCCSLRSRRQQEQGTPPHITGSASITS